MIGVEALIFSGFLFNIMTTYSEKLKKPKWQRKRLEILQRDNFTCVHCKDTETELHVHHLKYTGEPFEAPDSDLETVCKHCHSFIEYFKDYSKDNPFVFYVYERLYVAQVDIGTLIFQRNHENRSVDFENYFSFSPKSKTLELLYKINQDIT